MNTNPVTSSEANQLYTCSNYKTLPHEKHLHCSLTVMSSSLLVLNNDNERVSGIRQKVTLDLMLNSPFDPKAGTLKALIIFTPLCRKFFLDF